MAMNMIVPSLLMFSTLFLSLSTSNSKTIADSPSAYDMIEKYDFPRGILPEGVTGYVLNSDGSFEVYFTGDYCEFKVAKKYLIRYENKISGSVQTGTLKYLSGVSVKILFLWIGIDEVDRVSDTELSFYVGPLSISFAVSSFEESPKCRRSSFVYDS